MNGRSLRITLLATTAALSAALSSLAPTMAQSGPVLGSWLAGPDGQGSSTIVGRIEAPSRNQNVLNGASIQVAGWAADTTAAGWSGIDGLEVWSGPKGGSATKLATGIVGLTRADIGDALGGYFAKSGFTAVVPGSALANLKPGTTSLYVYLHTPGKGTWYRTATFSLAAPVTLAFATDPMVQIIKPQDGTAITQLQKTAKFTFSGFALDRNPITNPATQVLGPGCAACGLFGQQARGAGIASVSAYIDSRTDPVNVNLPSVSLYGNPLVSNLGSLNVPGKPQASIITRQYGSQFDYSGWSVSLNPQLLSPGLHTLFVTATSSVTPANPGCEQFATVGGRDCPGKTSTASVSFNILDMSHKKIQP